MEKSIIISSKIENLRLVESFVEQICSDAMVDQEKYANILVASLEATNNAIVHGNKLNEKANVVVTIKTSDTQINIEVKDSGPGFDYETVPDPTSPENIEKLNGRGIFLMKNLADKISFRNKGAIVELSFEKK